MIRVTNDFIIDVDDFNFVAKEDKHKTTPVKDKDGNITEKPLYSVIGYYTSLVNALEGIKKFIVLEKLQSKEFSLDDAILEVRTINKEFIDTFNRVIAENE